MPTTTGLALLGAVAALAAGATRVLSGLPLAVALAALAAAAAWVLSVLRQYRRYAHIPGPAPSFFGGNKAYMKAQGAMHDMAKAVHRDFGPLARLHTPLGGPCLVFTRDVDFIGEIISNKQDWGKPQGGTFGSFIPQGLLCLEGKRWHFHRKLISPMFSDKHLREYSALFQSELRTLKRLVGEAADSESALGDFYVFLTRFTLDVIGRVAFGAEFGCQKDPQSAYALAGDRIATESRRRTREPRVMWRFPRSRWQRWLHSLKQYDDVIDRMVAQRRAQGTESHADLLTKFLTAQDPASGGGFSPKELRDECFTMMLAGHETASNAVCWALMLLAQHPDVQDRARDEVLRVVGRDRLPHFNDCAELPFLNAVFFEALRLYPVVPVFPRRACRDISVQGVFIPEDTSVYFSSIVNMRAPEHWPEADSFLPERFMEGSPLHDAERHPMAFLPFGGGLRKCVGYRFAQAEAAQAIATVLQTAELAIEPDIEIKETCDMTLGPKVTGLKLRVRRLG